MEYKLLAQQIYDKGDFYGNTGYLVETGSDAIILRVLQQLQKRSDD